MGFLLGGSLAAPDLCVIGLPSLPGFPDAPPSASLLPLTVTPAP